MIYHLPSQTNFTTALIITFNSGLKNLNYLGNSGNIEEFTRKFKYSASKSCLCDGNNDEDELLTKERGLVLFTAGTIVRDPHLHTSPTPRELGLN